jgi:Cu(I)-responsive transcriptional regulator
VNVGEAARRAGLPVKTVHYYESIGLVTPERRPNGYRDYDATLVNKLGFLRRARGLGFSIEECRSLLSLYEDRSRASKDVKEIALAKLGDIEHKIQELRSLHGALSHLVEACHGDERPDCPILEDLARSPDR